MFQLIREKIKNSFYTSNYDPYLDAFHIALYASIPTIIVIIILTAFQWLNYLVLTIFIAFFIMLSCKPFGKPKKDIVITAIILCIGIAITMLGAAAVVHNRFLSILWVTLFTALLYTVCLKYKQYQNYVTLAPLCSVLFIHLFQNSIATAPNISLLTIINYLIALIISSFIVIFTCLILPLRTEGRITVAAIDLMFCTNKFVKNITKNLPLDNSSNILQRSLNHFDLLYKAKPNFKKYEKRLLKEYIDLMNILFLSLNYLVSNHTLDDDDLADIINKIDSLINTAIYKDTRLPNKINYIKKDIKISIKYDVISDILIVLDKIEPLYIKILSLRKKYV